MATLLLNLRHVPDDEAQEVRDLLEHHRIGYYETPPNWWGISMGGIWLEDPDQAEEAKALLDAYQSERAARSRAEYEQSKREGRSETLWTRLRTRPLQTLFYTAGVLLVLYFSTKPFLALGD